jgi:hypothetical protein
MLGYTGFVSFALFVARGVGRRDDGVAVGAVDVVVPAEGAFAGVVTALVTVLTVPKLFGVLLAGRELVGVGPPLFSTPIDAFVITVQGGVVYWGLFTGVMLVPLGALVGWAYQPREWSEDR